MSLLMPQCCFSSTLSSGHWSACRRLWKLCRDAHLILPVLVYLLLTIDVISKAETGDCFASNADSATVSFKGVSHDHFQKYVEEGGWEYTSLSDSSFCSKLVSSAAVEEDSTGDLIIEVLNDSDKVVSDAVKPCRRPSWGLWRHGRGLAGAGVVSVGSLKLALIKLYTFTSGLVTVVHFLRPQENLKK